MECKVTAKNSPFFEKNVKKIIAALAAFFVLFGLASQVKAQMFSVGESGTRYGGPMSEIFVGLSAMEATYQGDPTLSGAEAFEYDGPIVEVGYSTVGLDLYLGTGGKITGVDEGTYFHTGGNFDFGIRLYRSKKINLRVPLRLESQYTNITSTQNLILPSVNRFQFGMLAGGIGINGVFRPAKDVRVEVGAVPSYGFSFASGGFFGGSIGTVDVHGKLYFDRLFNDKGLSIGYSYDLRSYDVEENVYDYDLKGHSIEIGVTF